MTDNAFDDLSEIAGQLKEHLRFYSEMGVIDIGGCSIGGPLSAPSALSRSGMTSGSAEATGKNAVPEAGEYHEPAGAEPTPQAPSPGQQFNLFGEPVSPPSAPLEAKTGARAAQTPQVLVQVDVSLEAIREDIGECTRCRLSEHRTNIVFGEGNPKAKLVFVGEGPGADEDATGRPFVGRAGQLLDKIIASIGLRREDVYIANVVKCRPPMNRTPEKDETATCEPFLFRQLRFINPRVIVTLGLPALQSLLKSRESMTRARGQWRDWNDVKVMPTFHPAYLLRDPSKKREVWEDIKNVRDYLVRENLL